MAKQQTNPLMRQLFYKEMSKGDLRKISIIQSAIKCIATIGIDKMSFDAVGKNIGIKRSHIAYYFKDKRELVDASVRYIIYVSQNTVTTDMGESQKGWPQLETYLRSSFDESKKSPDNIITYLYYFYYAMYDESAREMQESIRVGGRKRIIQMLKNIEEVEDIKIPKLEIVAYNIHSQMAGMSFDIFSTIPKKDRAKRFSEAEEMLVDLARRLIYGR